MKASPDFVALERSDQSDFFARSLPDQGRHEDVPYRLAREQFAYNLAPSIRDAGPAYFLRPDGAIAWHQHANHALSSQVCCLNFLMPLATQRELLGHVIGHALGIAPPKMLRVEDGPDGDPWFVGFEWIGRADYLNEGGKTGARTRGANATSADAVVRFEHEGRTETLLIEWKYTETYGAPIDPKGNETRTKRYRDLAFAPDGPIRTDLGVSLDDFFYEPFYQLIRQQMLAAGMQAAREDGAERVRVLHISPAGNRVLHKVTSPALRRFGNDVFAVFSKLLVRPDDFISRSTEPVFGPALAAADGGGRAWADYLIDRYTFLNRPVAGQSPEA